jgi:uncharacterized protein YegL
MNKGFGVTISRPGDQLDKSALVVVAKDELDAELVAAKLAGSGAAAETMRELTENEVLEYGLDLAAHGSAKALAVPNL